MKRVALLALLAVVGFGTAVAQDPAEVMAAFMQYAEPDEHHKLLATAVGSWHIDGEFRMGPGGEWMTSTSEAEVEAILGGRFFVQRVSGPAMFEGGHPFEGLGIAGYDRIQGKYISAWADNHGTMMMTGMGTADATGKVITTDFTYTNPMTKQPAKARWVIHYVDGDHMTFEMYEHQDDEYFLAGKLKYTRAADK